MKKLNKITKKRSDTIEAFSDCSCGEVSCTCSCTCFDGDVYLGIRVMDAFSTAGYSETNYSNYVNTKS